MGNNDTSNDEPKGLGHAWKESSKPHHMGVGVFFKAVTGLSIGLLAIAGIQKVPFLRQPFNFAIHMIEKIFPEKKLDQNSETYEADKATYQQYKDAAAREVMDLIIVVPATIVTGLYADRLPLIGPLLKKLFGAKCENEPQK